MKTHIKYRYPGVKPFETAERALFFGRDRDIEDLLDLIWLEKLVVLFGKSGYGKSSLLNAGILPALEDEVAPVVVRLGSYNPGQIPMPLENLRKRIDEILPDNPEAAFLNAIPGTESLWRQIKRKQSHGQYRFVLIFDQFEEFFTYPVAEQNAFKEQLADLLYTEVPQTIRDHTEALRPDQQTFIATSFDVKMLLAIRADRLSLLDSMKDKLPAILQKRYELKGLSAEQARQAIEKPAASEGEFASPKFTFTPDALRLLTEKLAETKASQRSGIEAFQLQILCEFLESEIVAGQIPGNHIRPQHFQDKINDIYEGYYQRLIGKLEPTVQLAAELVIEEGLIFQDEKTGESRRLSVDSDVLVQRFGGLGVTSTMLRDLENQFLLRREATSTGGFNYEVSHDTLIAPILKSKAERKALEVAEQTRLETQRRQRRLLSLLSIALLALVIVVGVVIYVLQQKNMADKAKDEAEKARNEAIIERDKAEKALKGLLLSELDKLSQRVDIVLNSPGNCPDTQTMQQIRDLKNKYPEDIDVKTKFNKINDKLRASSCLPL